MRGAGLGPAQAKEARKDRETALAQVVMAKALSTGISWGLAEDAAASAGEDSDAGLGPGGSLDWRAYADTHVRHRQCGRSLAASGCAGCVAPGSPGPAMHVCHAPCVSAG